MEPIKLIVAEDNLNYRTGLLELLNKIAGVLVTGVAADGAELLRLVDEDPPHVVLTDIQMPGMSGIEAMPFLRKRHPDVGVIGLTMFPQESFLVHMLQEGARGYVYKDCTEVVLEKAITKVGAGQYYHCPTTIRRISQMFFENRLTHPVHQQWSETELQVVHLICQGYHTKEIAEQLGLAIGTVKQYRNQIIKKMGVKSMVGIVSYSWRHGLYRGEE